MAWTSPSQPIEIQPEGALFSFKASGSIQAGQAVVPQGSMEVGVPGNNTSNGIGIAAYDAEDGEFVMVYGPGNIVKAMISGTGSDTIGAQLKYSYGYLDVNGTGRVMAILLEAPSSLPGTGKVLLI